jgi:4'-phosphopantetheinyl transferase
MQSEAWFVDVSAWDPETPQWERAMALLPTHEQQQVQKFVFAKDQRLALASRLLQRQLIRSIFRTPWAEICIARTPEVNPRC